MKTIRYYLLLAAAYIIGCIICAPCFLLFTTGSEGQVTVWNFVGLAYSAAVVLTVRHLLKK